MFGYIRAYKPFLRVYEYEIYRSVYCGLCKAMGRRYGFFTRFTLSYDFTFLSLVDMAVRDVQLDAQAQRCVAHPLKKTLCATCRNDFGFPSGAAVILTYHKLKDDLADKGLKGKIAAAAMLPFFRKPYKLARESFPELAPKIEQAMKLQQRVEKEKTPSVDRACEPTAAMMTAVFGALTEDKDQKRLLERFGYLLGRYIYITDALDDAAEDAKKGSYNPLLLTLGIEAGGGRELTKKERASLGRLAQESVNMTLGEIGYVYTLLDFGRFRPILDNIVYMGLKNTFSSVKSGKFRKQRRIGRSRADVV